MFFGTETEMVLTPEHLQGSFAILTVGLIISVILFMAELLTYHFILPCWRYYHQDSVADNDKSSPTLSSDLTSKRKRHKKNQKANLNKESDTISLAKQPEDIVISWQTNEIIQEVPIQKDVRFTPLKPRIIQNRQTGFNQQADELFTFLK